MGCLALPQSLTASIRKDGGTPPGARAWGLTHVVTWSSVSSGLTRVAMCVESNVNPSSQVCSPLVVMSRGSRVRYTQIRILSVLSLSHRGSGSPTGQSAAAAEAVVPLLSLACLPQMTRHPLHSQEPSAWPADPVNTLLHPLTILQGFFTVTKSGF